MIAPLFMEANSALSLASVEHLSSEEEGHPLKGESREKTPLLGEKVPFFPWLRHTHQHGLVFTPFSHPLLPSFWFWSIADPHQSPIGIKAYRDYIKVP
jgi:hypothetical protein